MKDGTVRFETAPTIFVLSHRPLHTMDLSRTDVEAKSYTDTNLVSLGNEDFQSRGRRYAIHSVAWLRLRSASAVSF